jgi:serine phosphatase RsbU (regulator of sigma subunit)
VMAMLKSSVRTRLGAGGPLGEILQDVNRVLADLTDPTMFATLSCLRIRTREGGADIEYALAGHLPILHIMALGGGIRELPNESLPLGIEPTERYVSGHTQAATGDVLVLMTDGLMEVQGRDGHELGSKPLFGIVGECAGSELQEMHRRIMARVDGHGAQLDDQTLALVRIG